MELEHKLLMQLMQGIVRIITSALIQGKDVMIKNMVYNIIDEIMQCRYTS